MAVLLLALPRLSLAVEGLVLDAATGAPLAGASVRVQATHAKTTTDASGRFLIAEVPPEGRRVVAGAVGFYSQGAELDGDAPIELRLERVPYDPSAPVSLLAPSECAACHPSQYETWNGSPMAHAGQNRWVSDIYDGTGTPTGGGGFVYTRDSVLAATHPASECAACHAPERWLESPGAALAPFGTLESGEGRGVTCLVCHQMAEVHEDRMRYPGVHEGSVRMQRGGLVRFGVLGDVDFYAPGRMRASFQPQLTAAVCGACHQDASDPDGDGTFRGPASEATYEEWRSSPYADPRSGRYATCVDCHTEPTSAGSASSIASVPPRPAGEVRGHRFEGTTARFLDSALTLEVVARPSGARIEVVVRLTNTGAGHHVPSGVTMRNVILLVEASVDGEPLELASGPRVEEWAGLGSPADGDFAGLPGRFFATINEDASGNGPVVFTEARRIRRDSRIPALGTDESHYSFGLPRGGSVRVVARVLYRRAFRSIVQAKGWTEDGHGNALEDVKPPYFGHVMASRELELQAPSPGFAGGGCAAGGGRRTPTWPWWPLVPALLWRARRRRRLDP